MCSAPRTGNRFRQKCRIISGMDLKGRLNWPRMYSPLSFCCWIRMCMKPLALLRIIWIWLNFNRSRIRRDLLERQRIILLRRFAVAHQETSLTQLSQHIFGIDSRNRSVIPSVDELKIKFQLIIWIGKSFFRTGLSSGQLTLVARVELSRRLKPYWVD